MSEDLQIKKFDRFDFDMRAIKCFFFSDIVLCVLNFEVFFLEFRTHKPILEKLQATVGCFLSDPSPIIGCACH